MPRLEPDPDAPTFAGRPKGAGKRAKGKKGKKKSGAARHDDLELSGGKNGHKRQAGGDQAQSARGASQPTVTAGSSADPAAREQRPQEAVGDVEVVQDRPGADWPLGEWLRGDWLRGDWAGGDWPLAPWLGGDRSSGARGVGGAFSLFARDSSESTGPPPKGGAAPPGTEALQAAALQAISAAKAFLDLAERAVHDPEVVGHVASVVGTAAQGLLGSLGSFAGGLSGSRTGEDEPPLEHIDVE
jgi:hypothetical protein